MKIIIVDQYFWPDNFLVNDIAEEMVKRGHQVLVLTGLPDYSTGLVPDEFKHGKRRHEFHNGVEIIRVPIIARHTGFTWRVFNYLSFFINSSVYARLHKFDADVIFAYETAPILMVNSGIILKKKLHKPFFLYCLDIWPDQMKVWNVYENNPLFKITLKYSQHAYGSADIVGITSKPFKKYLVEVDKVDPDRIVYLPQHADEMKLKEAPVKTDDTVNFVFAGNIGQQQNAECILRAVSKMDNNLHFHVHIYGNGTSYEECRQLANDLNINDKVTFYGRVSKEVLNEAYPRMDAFLLTLRSEKEIGFTANTVPAKFQGYLSAGKPVIAAIDGGAKDIINEIKCGIAVPSGDVDGLANAMTDFIKNPDKYKECGKRGKGYFESQYRKDVVMDRIEELLINLKDSEI